MLHILRHPPLGDSRFASCLRVLDSRQSLLLTEDAVYALLPGTQPADSLELLPKSVELYALESDVLARGLALDALPVRVKRIDYLGMVELCVAHSKVVSW